MAYLDTPDTSYDDMIRRRNLLMGMPNMGFDQPIDAQGNPVTADQAPWYMAQNQAPQDQTPSQPQVQPQVQPPTQPQQAPTQPQPVQPLPPMDPKYAPKYLDPSSLPQLPPSQRFEQAATALENVGQAPRPQDFKRNKLLTALVAPLMLKQYIRNPQAATEAMDFMTRKGYGRAEQEYAQRFGQAQQTYKIETDVLGKRLDIFTKGIQAGDAQMAMGKYNQWVHTLPLEEQERVLKIAADQAEAVKRNAPTYSKTLEAIRIRKPDGSTEVREGYLKTFPDGRTPEYVIPGIEGTIKMKDAVAVSKPASTSSNPLIQQIEDKRQEIRDRFGREPTPEEDDKLIGNVRLLAQQGMQARQATMDAKKTIGGHINKDFITPMNKKLVELQNVKTTLAEARGTNDPEKIKNAVAASLAPLEEVRAIVGSGRVAVSEYPLIASAPGKPQSFVGYIRNLLGQGSPIPNAVLDDLDKFVTAQLNDTTALREIANKWGYSVLDANTEEEAKIAGQGFDKELKEFQNPSKPLTNQQKLDKIDEAIKKKTGQ